MVILGIDTSCDDTGVGIVRDGQVLANVVASQTALHARYGGVVPEMASREHLTVIDGVLEQSLAEAGLTLDDVDAVAATYGPGLVGALLVGLSYAKALAWSRNIPFIPVHHLEGHITSAASNVAPPFLCLVASGGHTSLFDVSAPGSYTELGKTRDDAAGEAFDKVARLLGLSYPGGPALSKLGERGDPEAFAFPLPLKHQKGFDFSFSGLKTAVAVLLQKEPEADRADIAASFERIVVESLVDVSLRAAKACARDTLIVAGGVSANRELRGRFAATDVRVHFPPLNLTTDNGAMIALAAAHADFQGAWDADAVPYLPLGSARRPTAAA